MLCPNAALEAVATRRPATKEELERVAELKPWFVREFADEILVQLRAHQDEEDSEAGS